MNIKRVLSAMAVLVLAFGPVLSGKTKKIKKIKASANPPEYVAFSKLLDRDSPYHHALDRLTFGPRPGDYDRLKQIRLEEFVDLQLNPERVPENPVVAERLKPFDSLNLSIRETYLHYPAPRLIVQVARGNGRLPDDPELRAIVVYLAKRYLEKRAQVVPATLLSGAPADDESDLDHKVKLNQILTLEQIRTLQMGKPDEKKAILASLPPDKMTDFVWALRPQQRNRLQNLAPVDLRRKLMLYTNPQQVVASDLMEGKLLRAIYSNHQLEELLVDFWYNHFNVYLNKGGERYLATSYERDAIRPFVLGKFSDLLTATAKSPAMLFYLDNFDSVAPGVKKGLNENYGRELLELHTLGVDGGYTQKDVIAVARCFTGWTIAGPRKGDAFTFNPKVHDKGEKIVLGHKIAAGGGIDDGLKVIDILAHHPSTAHYISLKLAKRFVADNPPPSLVNRMADTFRKTDGNLREVMRTMLMSGEFWSQGAYQAKIKTPLEMIVSAVRATNADVQTAYQLAAEIQRLGEPLYRKIEPTGYSSSNAEWVSSAGLLDRMNFAMALANNKVGGVKVDMAQWQARAAGNPMNLARFLLARDPTEQTKAAIQKTLDNEDLQKQLSANAQAGPTQIPSLVAGLVIGSPEFQRH
jgi:uncharacterized protein (DUF1800 family)